MSFFMLQLIFAGLVVVLLVVAALIVRQLRNPPAASEKAPKAARPRKLRPARAAAEPEPEPESPPPPRRRQLRSFVENERDEQAEAELPPPAVEPPAAPPAADYAQEVLGRLEAAFDELQAGEMALDDYRGRLLSEQAAVEERLVLLHDGDDDAELEAALAARESVRWCLDWADEQERASE